MNYNIEKGNGPAYLQLYRFLRNDIIDGVYEYNTKLPSKRILADEATVSTITVEHAYALLCDEGYAEARERSGYFVIFQKDDGFATTKESSNATVSLSHGNQAKEHNFPYSVLCKTMRKIMLNYENVIMEKSPNAGCIEFRTA